MLHVTRFHLGAAAMLVAAALPFVLRTGLAGEEAPLAPVADRPLAVDDDTKDWESPCPCRSGGGERDDDGEAPFEVIKFLHPRFSEESLWKGTDLALVYADVPGLEPDFYLLRVYAFGDEVLSTLVDRHGDEIPLETRGFSIGEPGYVEACTGGGDCDVVPNPDGTLTKVCCYFISCSNGFVWFGCFSTDSP